MTIKLTQLRCDLAFIKKNKTKLKNNKKSAKNISADF